MHYRLYTLSPTTGGIVKGNDIVAESDAAAIRQGRDTLPGTPFEIWCQSRLVFTVGKPSTGAFG